MPRYEFRCRSCDGTFEVDRPMSAANDPAACPRGHADTVKLLSTVSLGGRTRSAPTSDGYGRRRSAADPGGCCGGSCGCR